MGHVEKMTKYVLATDTEYWKYNFSEAMKKKFYIAIGKK